jgi:sirohydrochlorin ferrochelatase
MNEPTLLLLDNGSTRCESTLNLRRLAARLSETSGRVVHPVSLQHADKVEPAALDGRRADTLVEFLTHRLAMGERDFLVIPLFFGPSKAITAYIPEQVALLAQRFGPIKTRIADVLCPLPEGEPRLARILCDNVTSAARDARVIPRNVILVDHGSPLREVTQARTLLAQQMRDCLGPEVLIEEAVMERRAGPQYDFNGPLLLDALREQAKSKTNDPVILCLMFLNPGRHAGAGGDIERICAQAQEATPGLRVLTSPLVGTHPGLVEILQARLDTAIDR